MKKISREVRQNILEDILKLVSIKSITGDAQSIKNCQEEVRKIAYKLGFETRLVAKGKVLMVEPPDFKGRAKQGVVVHLDTVPFDYENWKHDPLGEIIEGRLWGRGVIDDKMPVVLALYSVWLLEEEIEPSWQIIIGSDEEDGWTDMKEYKEEKPIFPEFLFTIDGDGVQNGSRGYLDLSLKFSRNASTQRITEFYVPNGVNNSVPGKAIAKIDGKTIEQDGIACHSSEPSNGINALVKLAEKVVDINEFDGFFKFMNIYSLNSEAVMFGFKISKKIEEVGDDYTTVVPTMCSVEGDFLEVNLNVRLAVGTTKQDVEDAVMYIENTFECQATISQVIYPAFVSKENSNIQMMAKAYEETLGKKANVSIARGVGYNAALPNCVIFGPRYEVKHDESDFCHAANENRKISDIFKFLDMLNLYFKYTLK